MKRPRSQFSMATKYSHFTKMSRKEKQEFAAANAIEISRPTNQILLICNPNDDEEFKFEVPFFTNFNHLHKIEDELLQRKPLIVPTNFMQRTKFSNFGRDLFKHLDPSQVNPKLIKSNKSGKDNKGPLNSKNLTDQDVTELLRNLFFLHHPQTHENIIDELTQGADIDPEIAHFPGEDQELNIQDDEELDPSQQNIIDEPTPIILGRRSRKQTEFFKPPT